MGWSRRGLVGVVASGLLTGCAGVSVPRVPNPLGGGDRGKTRASQPVTPAETATAEPSSAPTATPTPTAPGAETRRVFDEVEWFAAKYPHATGEFRSLAARMRNLADSLSRRSSVDDDAMATLNRLADRIGTSVSDRLGPHFDTSPSVREFTRERIDRIETLRSREDWDEVSRVLSDLAARYATFTSESYVARTFPRDPVRGPLVDYATGDGRADAAVLMAFHVGADAEVRIQRDPSAYTARPPGGRPDLPRYRALFGPLAAGAGSAAGAYLTVTSLISDRTVPLSIRRYRDERAAERAIDRLLSGGVTEEGTTEAGGREWRRVFYRPGSDVVYADLTRAGPFLVAAGPSRQPWEDRPSGWRSPLKLTWLWE